MKNLNLGDIGKMKQNKSSIKISPSGIERPASYRSGDAENYYVWKICQELNTDELQAYICNIKNKLKYANDGKENLDLRRQLKIVSDTYEIKSRNPSATEDYYSRLIYESKEYGTQLLTYIGFGNQTIYTDELYSICDCLYKDLNLLSKCKVYDGELYATVLVSLILEKFGAKYNEGVILSYFDITEKEYLNLKIILSKWMNGNYWK